jgi:proline dehydrogenase
MLTRSALIYLSRQEGLKEFAARFSLFRKLTTRFIAGETIDEAIAAIREVNAHGCTASFDHLNEGVTSAKATGAEVAEYLNVLARIDDTSIKSNVSIKLTQFGLEIDPGWRTERSPCRRRRQTARQFVQRWKDRT